MKPVYKNMSAKCIDRNNPCDMVLHEVSYERKDPEGNWTAHVEQIMATDPMHAIKTVQSR